MKLAWRFLIVLCSGVASAVVGAFFGLMLAVIAPELVQDLFSPSGSVLRYAAGVGMVFGLFIGTGVMGFCMLIGAFISWSRERKRGEQEKPSAPNS